ncbi:histone deacetylase complex subunit SAP25-like [Suncus etruscus]|uniref:histone deacetylase complex subunit SAP25-like n=1 Tax=Suncus etruscus TaxID=109475 RepID=UPI0021102BB1|nr:histone deacetylase complex subunit SAP25-like [Suncus etruscus]
MTLLMPWDPKYKVKTRGSQLWGAGSSSGGSFANRTLCHPSFWPLYRAVPYCSLGPKEPGSEAKQSSTPTEVPVLGSEDVFLSDPLLPLCPLLPQCQRIPLHLSKPPEQVKGSLKLLLPPPIMASSVMPSCIPVSSSTRLSRAELIALKGLLQMSQGEPKPSSSSGASDDPPNRVSDPPGPMFNPSDPEFEPLDPVSEPSNPLIGPSRPVSDPLRPTGTGVLTALAPHYPPPYWEL